MKSELAVMDKSGDTKLMWDKDNEDEVEAARTTFNKLKKKGFFAYTVTDKDGSKGKLIKEFDPDAQKIIMSPVMVAG